MATGIKILVNGIEKNLNAMTKRSNAVDSWLNRSVYQTYQDAQRTRWMTEDAAYPEGIWPRLNKDYEIKKKKRFAQYDGGGQRMLIATGKLYKDVIGGGDDHRKVIDRKKLKISTTNKYAVYVDKPRDVTRFPKTFYDQINKDLSLFIKKGYIK